MIRYSGGSQDSDNSVDWRRKCIGAGIPGSVRRAGSRGAEAGAPSSGLLTAGDIGNVERSKLLPLLWEEDRGRVGTEGGLLIDKSADWGCGFGSWAAVGRDATLSCIFSVVAWSGCEVGGSRVVGAPIRSNDDTGNRRRDGARDVRSNDETESEPRRRAGARVFSREAAMLSAISFVTVLTVS